MLKIGQNFIKLEIFLEIRNFFKKNELYKIIRNFREFKFQTNNICRLTDLVEIK